METLFTGKLHGFTNFSRAAIEPVLSEESLLSLLIVLGSSVSLVGLVFAFITYSLFSDLRNLSGTTLMNLLAALFMTQLLYVIGVGGVPDPELCIGLAFSLQYIRLCVFCWMVVITHLMYNQFRSNMHLLPIEDDALGKHFFIYSAFAWGCPGLFLGASIYIQYQDKAGSILDTESLKGQNCWFLDTHAFIFTFVLPSTVLSLIIGYYLARSVIVARIIVNMQLDRKIRDKIEQKRTLQTSLYMKISGLIILITTIGVLMKFFKYEPIWIAYHIGQGLQGILIAMLVTCNCQVLKLYTRSLKCRGKNLLPANSNRNITVEAKHILSKKIPLSKSSTSLQLLTWESTDPV